MAGEMTGFGAGCLAEHTLDALSAGRLSPAEQAAVASHLDRCDACRELLAALAHVDGPEDRSRAPAGAPGRGEGREEGARSLLGRVDDPADRSGASSGALVRVGAVEHGSRSPLAPLEDLEDSPTVSPSTRRGAQRHLFAGDRVGRYTVLHLVGAGAMGTVYAAYDPELDRRVALKLVHHGLLAGATREAAAARLLREAQALARLSDPNIVTVFDAGRFEGQVFLAMEFVEGGTLRQWLASERRDPAQIVAMFVAAGRGLAALHGAGLVHRDFKPDNVLVGGDGRARVSDFGLVRVAATASVEETFDPARPLPTASEAMTRTGALLGTPAYMAPELWQGALADARSDQFAFCVALYEALQGVRPFTPGALAGTAPGREVARVERIPAGLRAPLAIGLARAPERRHASMTALLDALGRGLAGARRRRAALLLGLAGLVVALSAWGWQQVQARELAGRVAACVAAGARIDEVWGAAARAEVERSFLATGKAFAPATFARTVPWLDGWAADWRGAAEAACRAHTVEASWDAELRARAEDCLAEARAGFVALVDELRDADGVVLTQATNAAAELAPASACTQPAALRERAEVPQAQRSAARELRVRLAGARSLQAVGDYDAALTAARAAVGAARASGLPGLVGEAEFRAAGLHEKRGDYPAAEAGLLRALAAAEEARARGLALAITTDLAYVVGYAAARPAEGRVWARSAHTQLALHAGASPLEEAHLDSRLAAVDDVVGDYAEAARLHARAGGARAGVGPVAPGRRAQPGRPGRGPPRARRARGRWRPLRARARHRGARVRAGAPRRGHDPPQPRRRALRRGGAGRRGPPVRARSGDLRARARARPPRRRRDPARPRGRPAGPRRGGRVVAPPDPRAGDLRARARARPPAHGRQPQQPGAAAPRHGRAARGRAAVRARARGLRALARARSPRGRLGGLQPRAAAPRRRSDRGGARAVPPRARHLRGRARGPAPGGGRHRGGAGGPGGALRRDSHGEALRRRAEVREKYRARTPSTPRRSESQHRRRSVSRRCWRAWRRAEARLPRRDAEASDTDE
ncbi:protein kinase [Nannocystis pusilla]|uniref:Protein kinase n=1 Tax=Nannocystis pusilla TaxID=889268 RepID=A0A9X3F1J3_9BACT|nr:protein kinase [Nannocystis pusilla]MCY1013595.1 protein kinase [Nannocystis pusilla]